MATAHAYRRQGNGARLLASVLADAAASGARCGVLYASPDGEQMYRSLGYAAREYCQIWSRPRWVLARS
jgi:predicted acetyltransferase